MRRFDWVALAERAYDLELAPRGWMLRLGDAIRPLFDPDSVLFGGLARRGNSGFEVDADFGPRWLLKASYMTWRFAPRATESYFSARGWVVPSMVHPTAAPALRLAARVLGRPYGFVGGLVCADEQGRYLSLMGSRPSSIASTVPKVRRGWRYASEHIGAGLRLRRSVKSLSLDEPAVEGVFAGPEFKAAHACGPVKDADLRAHLRRVVVMRERARSRVQRADPSSLELWPALTSGRWSLVDRFDTDGRRFVVAYRNSTSLVDGRALTTREHGVAELVARGLRTKDIAARLRISQSTARSQIASVLAKLGLESRLDLVVTWHQAHKGRFERLSGSPDIAASVSLPSDPIDQDLALTPAEREVVALVLAGRTNSEIAVIRAVSPKTIESQIGSIFSKLGIASRAELGSVVLATR